MKRKEEAAKDRCCSSLEPIHLDLKLTRLPAKFLMKTHQKKRVESLVLLGSAIKREDDQKDKLDPIPFDLEVEILTRLPAKSLMKFRCVSKMWSFIIRSQRFVDSYYALSSTRSRFTVTFSSNALFAEDDAKRLFIFSSSYEEEKSSSLVAKLDITIPFVTMDYRDKCPSIHGFVSCCNGPLAQFIVCNPSTRQVITLPIKAPRASLGYDPVGDQFKVLNLVSSPDMYRGFLVHEVITLGGGGEESRNQVTTAPYYPVTKGLYINGSIYHGAWAPRPRMDPVIVCFDVRHERLSFIRAPRAVVVGERESILIDYKGKLASIAAINPYAPNFQIFDLWILEDVNKHEWSKQTLELPFPLVDMTSPGTNKAGEIIFAPMTLPHTVQPFFIFYYNVETKDIRRVRLHGIADDKEFWRRYGLRHNMCVSISPEHVESVASL